MLQKLPFLLCICSCYVLLTSTYLTGMPYAVQENRKSKEIIHKSLFLLSVVIVGIMFTVRSFLSGPV